MDMYQKRKMRQEKKNNNQEEKLTKVGINWYPGHMAKAKRQIGENINLIDVVLEVVDARIPKSSKIIDIDKYTKSKPRIMVMTKYDLCDKKETQKWIEYYEQSGYTVIPIDLFNDSVSSIIHSIMEIMSKTNEKLKDKGLKPRRARVLVVGIPNVGKSTLINRLVGKKAVAVGNKPGVTKSLNWIRINDSLELLDTPGILWPKFEGNVGLNLASLTAIKEEILPNDQVAIYILNTLATYYPSILKERYGVLEINEDIIVTLEEIGKRRGCLMRGGEIDYDKVFAIILKDIKDGVIKNITFDQFL
jgi:ribosome biogenesis GTPase A